MGSGDQRWLRHRSLTPRYRSGCIAARRRGCLPKLFDYDAVLTTYSTLKSAERPRQPAPMVIRFKICESAVPRHRFPLDQGSRNGRDRRGVRRDETRRTRRSREAVSDNSPKAKDLIDPLPSIRSLLSRHCKTGEHPTGTRRDETDET
jgi:hypothetical protein